MQIVTFLIAVAGFAMSMASWVHTFVTQRKKFDVEIVAAKSYADVTYLHLIIQNKSRLPVAITRISLLLNGMWFNCTPIPVMVSATERKRGSEVIKRTEEYSTALPIQLSSLGATNCLVLFEGLPYLPSDDATHLTLSIYTNRGKAVKRSLELPAEWASQRKVP